MDDDLKAVVERVANFSLHLSNRRIAFKAAFAAAYGHDAGPQKSALNADLRTLLSALRQRDEALTSIRQQARLADDPDHHTLGLIDKIAEAALIKGAAQ